MRCRGLLLRRGLAALLALGAAGSGRAQPAGQGARVLGATGVEAGLAVVVGTTDGVLEAELTNGGRMLVHGLALSDEAAAKACQHIFAKKLYGLASVARVHSVTTLPYYDRIVNLLVADLDALGKGSPSAEEIERVLGYEGVAYVKKGGRWSKTVKPTPKEVDTWTHYAHDASGNPVSKDLVAGPPNAARWIGGPFGRNLIGGLRSSDGTAVQINPTYNVRLLDRKGKGDIPPNLRGLLLWAHDVNSGVLLWHRKISDGGGDGHYSYSYANTFVASGGRVFGFDFTAADQIALTAWNLRTGAVERVFDKAVVCRKADYPGDPRKGRDWRTWANDTFAHSTVLAHEGKVVHAVKDKLFVMDAATGEVLWMKESGKAARFLKVLISGERLVALVARSEGYHEQLRSWVRLRAAFPLEAAQAWQWKDGKPLWRSDLSGLAFPSDTLGLNFGSQDPYLLLPAEKTDTAKGFRLVLLDARDGSRVWEKPGFGMTMGLCIIRDKIWVGRYGSGPFGGVYSLATGEGDPVRRNGGLAQSACDAPTATLNWFMGKRNFMPVEPGPDSCQWLALRPMGKQCGERAAASYGSVFGVSVYCGCDQFIRGTAAFYAVKPTAAAPDDRRLTKGGAKAMGPVERQSEARKSRLAFEWGKPEDVKSLWWASGFRAGGGPCLPAYGLTETAPVQAGELALRAYVHENRLAALRGEAEVWSFVAGGRIGSPPAVHAGLAIFGSHDGYVYAVNVKDAAQAWRFLAAPADRRHVVLGQVESVWPVFNVVVQDGNVYCSAGRHEELEGGIHFYCLDAATGAMKWHVKRQRGLESDREPIRARKTGHGLTYLSGRESKLPTDGRALLNDAIEVRDGKIHLFDVPVVDLAAPADTIKYAQTLVPPQVAGVKTEATSGTAPGP